MKTKTLPIAILFNLLFFGPSLAVFGQVINADTLILNLENEHLEMLVEGDLKDKKPLTFSQLKMMKAASGAPFLNFGFAATSEQKYTVKMIFGSDTLTYPQWELPRQYLQLVYQKDTLDIFINAFKNPELKFSEEYQVAFRGKATVLMPKAYELVNILLSLSNYGENENLPFKKDAYWKKVQAHFSPYKNHKAVVKLNRWFDQQGSAENKNTLYYTLRMDGLSYELSGQGELEENAQYKYLGGKNGLQSILKEMEDFVKTSGFLEFYQTQNEYYQSALAEFHSKVDPQGIWTWLEDNFEESHDHYKVILTTLSNGLHNTRKLENNGFSEILMIISAPPIREKTETKNWEEVAKLERQLFTEVDHNYINSIGQKHQTAIDEAIQNSSDWYDSSKHGSYNSSLAIFLEYMTWAVFSCYAFDNYPKDHLEEIREQHVEFMEKKRLFLRFGEFESHLLNLYQSRKEEVNFDKMTELMIQWMKDFK